PVALEHERAADDDLSRGPDRDLSVVVVDELDLTYGHRLACRPGSVPHALEAHEAARLRLAESRPELRIGLGVQPLDGLGRVEPRDASETGQAAAHFGRRIEQGRQHGGEVRDMRDVVLIDEAYRLVR